MFFWRGLSIFFSVLASVFLLGLLMGEVESSWFLVNLALAIACENRADILQMRQRVAFGSVRVTGDQFTDEVIHTGREL